MYTIDNIVYIIIYNINSIIILYALYMMYIPALFALSPAERLQNC